MKGAWLSDVGIRVTNLARSVAFYRNLLDLEELVRRVDDDSAYVLLRDRRSGQRLELNWYARKNPFWAPYVVGEGLDHIEVRVRDTSRAMARLKARGIRSVNRSLWTNRRALPALRANPEYRRMMNDDVWTTSTGHRIVYVEDPDGLLLCLYDHPEEEWEGPIPDHY